MPSGGDFLFFLFKPCGQVNYLIEMKEKSKKKEKKKMGVGKPLVDMQELSLVLGLSLPTLRARLREGLPCVQEGSRGKAWQFDLAECVAWNTDRAVNKAVGTVDAGLSRADLELQILVEDLKLKRVAAAKVLGEVAPLDDVERAISSAFVEVRQAMLALPDRVALRVLALDSETEVKSLLEEEIDIALSSLVDIELLESAEDE